MRPSERSIRTGLIVCPVGGPLPDLSEDGRVAVFAGFTSVIVLTIDSELDRWLVIIHEIGMNRSIFTYHDDLEVAIGQVRSMLRPE